MVKGPGKRGCKVYFVAPEEIVRAKLIAEVGFVATLFIFLACCLPSKPLFSPLPPEVTSIEGHATLKLTKSGETARVRLTFLFLVPELGHIEIQDFLRRTSARLFMMEDGALLVLPAQRVYWRAERQEAIEKLLGFSLAQEDITAILQGKWDKLTDWEMKRDERMRVVGATRGPLKMEVEEFFGSSGLPKRMLLSRDGDRGSLRILSLRFNQPLKEGMFDFSFIEEKGFKFCAWEEIERLLRDED